MRLTLRLSPALQQTINGRLELSLPGATIGQCLQAGQQNFAELGALLFKRDRLNPQILLFHNNTLITASDFTAPVAEQDVLDIIPAIEAG